MSAKLDEAVKAMAKALRPDLYCAIPIFGPAEQVKFERMCAEQIVLVKALRAFADAVREDVLNTEIPTTHTPRTDGP